MATIITYGNLSVTLPSPDFDNAERIEFDRINRKSRAGDVILFRDPEWTHKTLLRMTFSFTTQKKLNQLLELMYQAAGKTITLIDFEGFTWNGLLTLPSAPVGQPGRENFTCQVEFQGTKV